MRRIFLITLLCLAVVGEREALAYRMEPLVVTLSPSGPNAREQFKITNTRDKRIALQFLMKERSITKRGEEKLSPEKQDFIIAPPQTILDPGEQQVVRLQYVGPASLTSEAAYRLIADPVQVRKPEQMDGTKVNILFRYEASVYVTPENTKPDLIAEDVKLAQGDGANTTLVVSFKNQGGRHILPQNLEPVVTTGDERVPLTDASVETFRKTNFLAGSTVVLQLDLKRELHSADGLDVALR